MSSSDKVVIVGGYTVDGSGMVWNISNTSCDVCKQKSVIY